MEALEAELAFANKISSHLLETVNLIDRRLMALEKETLPIRRLTEKLHLAQTNISAVLDDFDDISSHFATLDGFANPSFDADMLFRCSISIAYLKEHRHFHSTPDALERLIALQAQGRKQGSEQLQRQLLSDDVDRLAEARQVIEVLLTTGDAEGAMAAISAVRGKKMLSALESVYVNGNRDAFLTVTSPYSAGAHPFTRLLSKLGDLIERERKVFSTILPDPHPAGWLIAFKQTCSGAVQSCCSAGIRVMELLQESSWRSLNGDGFVVLLDVFANFAAALPSLLSHLGDFPNLCAQLTLLKDQLLEAARSSLDAIEGDIKRDASDIPESCTVLVLTSDVSGFLRRFKSAEPSFRVYNEMARGSYPPRSCIDALLRTLEVKVSAMLAGSDQQSRMVQAATRAKASLFMATNLTYIIKNMQESPELADTQVELRSKLQKNFDECCCAGWKEATEHFTPIPEGTLAFKGKTITFESGRVLKGRFDAFNKDLDDLVSRLAMLSVPDTDLRDKLRAEINSVILPSVSAFHASWDSVTFSKKHQDEYLRYTPSVVLGKVNGLFA